MIKLSCEDWLPQFRVCVRGDPCLIPGVGDADHKPSDGSSSAGESLPPLPRGGGKRTGLGGLRLGSHHFQASGAT